MKEQLNGYCGEVGEDVMVCSVWRKGAIYWCTVSWRSTGRLFDYTQWSCLADAEAHALRFFAGRA